MVTKGYGFTVEDIDWSCPADLEPYSKAYELEQKEKDAFAHLVWGAYGLSAFQTTMAHFGASLAGKHSKAEYKKEPVFSKNKKQNNSQEEIAVFEMKKRARLLERNGLSESPM